MKFLSLKSTGIILVLFLVICLLAACGDKVPESSDAENTQVVTQVPVNSGLPDGYMLEVKQTGDYSGMIRFTDPNMQTAISTENPNLEYGLPQYSCQIIMNEAFMLIGGCSIMESDSPDYEDTTIPHATIYVNNNFIETHNNPHAEAMATLDGNSLSMNFTFPADSDFSWEDVSQFNIIVPPTAVSEHQQFVVPMAQASWDDSVGSLVEFSIHAAVQGNKIYIRMPKPNNNVHIFFGDINMNVQVTDDDYYATYGGMDIQVDGMVAGPVGHTPVNVFVAPERYYGSNNILVVVEADGKNYSESGFDEEIQVQWEEKDNFGQFSGNNMRLKKEDVLLPFGEMELLAKDMMLDSQMQAPESPLPERGTIFSVPADFGYEEHEGDKAYFFQYSDDFAIEKIDLRWLYPEFDLPGKVDLYIAFNYKEDNPGRSRFQLTKYVLDDHKSAVQLVRMLNNHGGDDRSAKNIEQYMVIDNVVYPYFFDEPNDLPNGWKPDYPYTQTDKIWLTNSPFGIFAAGVYDRGVLIYHSKKDFIDSWNSNTAKGVYDGGSFYVSKP